MITTLEPTHRTARPRRRSEVALGAAEAVPLLVGYAPFALVVGSAIASHAEPVAGWVGIWTVISGSALLSTLQALDAGAALVAAFTGLLVNARLALYSASMRSSWAAQPRWFRLVGALLLIDPSWAIAERRARAPGSDADRRAHYLGAAVTLLVGWATMITVGVLVGASGGPVADLGVAVPLCLVVLIAPRLRDPSGRWTVVAAAGVTVVALGWPSGAGMLLAIACGAGIGAARRQVTAGARP